MRVFRQRRTGFSLVELLIVVAVILILSALAIPQLLRAKIAANEASAVSAVRNIYSMQIQYAQLYPTLGFATDISQLGPPSGGAPPTAAHANLLDFVLGCAAQPCPKSGYLFSIDQTSGSPIDSFRVVAIPQAQGTTGIRGFCVSSNGGNITADPNGGSNCTSPI